MEHGAPAHLPADTDLKLRRLQQLLAVDPANGSLRQHLFDSAMAAKRFDIVQSEAERILKLEPQNELALFNLANAFIGTQRYEPALAALRVLEQRFPEDGAIRVNTALCHYCLGDYAHAKPYLEGCYKKGVHSADVLRLLISSYHHLGMMDEAVAIAKEHAEMARSDAALAGIYALLFLDADDVAQAAKWTKIALDLNPSSVDARITHATLLTARMETNQARNVLEALINESPQLGRAWIGLGTLDLLAQDLPTAKQRLARGLELMPTHVGSWHVLAWAQMMSGELDAAEASFNQSLTLDRNFAETHGGLASVAAMRGDRAKSEHLIEVARRLDGECLSAKFAESVLMGKAGDAQKARTTILDTALALSSTDSSALGRLLGKMARR